MREKTGSVCWKSGRWQSRITDAAGVRRWVDLGRPDLPNSEAGKAKARELATKVSKDIANLVLGPESPNAPRGTTVADVAQSWFALLDEQGVRPSTRYGLINNVTNHVLPEFGPGTFEALTTPRLLGFIEALQRKVSSGTAKNICNAFARFVEESIDREWVKLDESPLSHKAVRKAWPKSKDTDCEEIVVVPTASLQAVIEDTSVPFERRCLYLLAVTSGARAGELFGIQWPDLDFDAAIPSMKITKQLLCYRGTGKCALGPPKTKHSKRTLPLHPAAIAMLQDLALEPGVESKTFVFGGGARDFHLAERLRSDLAACGQPTSNDAGAMYDLHCLRHTFATLLGECGVDGDIADRLLGHTPSSTRTKHYVKPSDERMREAVARLPFTTPRVNGLPGNHGQSSLEVSLASSNATQDSTETAIVSSGYNLDVSKALSFLLNENPRYDSTRPSLDLGGKTQQNKPSATLNGNENSASQWASDCDVTAEGHFKGAIASTDAPTFDAVEDALAEALRGASAAGRWDVVGLLAGELQARRVERAGNVIALSDRPRRGR